ncbi:MAG: helix-turn-helix domain-containing protein [Euryarchaeota archaeon]|nr:helix-turn-helix domain-containing protein [Euryarchaeota archaeon]
MQKDDPALRRVTAVLRADEGWSLRQISAHLHASTNSISKWIRMCQGSGNPTALLDVRRGVPTGTTLASGIDEITAKWEGIRSRALDREGRRKRPAPERGWAVVERTEKGVARDIDHLMREAGARDVARRLARLSHDQRAQFAELRSLPPFLPPGAAPGWRSDASRPGRSLSEPTAAAVLHTLLHHPPSAESSSDMRWTSVQTRRRSSRSIASALGRMEKRAAGSRPSQPRVAAIIRDLHLGSLGVRLDRVRKSDRSQNIGRLLWVIATPSLGMAAFAIPRAEPKPGSAPRVFRASTEEPCTSCLGLAKELERFHVQVTLQLAKTVALPEPRGRPDRSPAARAAVAFTRAMIKQGDRLLRVAGGPNSRTKTRVYLWRTERVPRLLERAAKSWSRVSDIEFVLCGDQERSWRGAVQAGIVAAHFGSLAPS